MAAAAEVRNSLSLGKSLCRPLENCKIHFVSHPRTAKVTLQATGELQNSLCKPPENCKNNFASHWRTALRFCQPLENCLTFLQLKKTGKVTAASTVFFFPLFFVVVVGSDRNSVGSNECRCTLEVFHRTVGPLPHRCVSRPSLCSQLLVVPIVL